MALKLWTVSATADYLGVTEQRVYSMAREGICPAVVRLGRQVRFHPEKLQQWIEAGGTVLPGGWRREPPVQPDSDEGEAQPCNKPS